MPKRFAKAIAAAAAENDYNIAQECISALQRLPHSPGLEPSFREQREQLIRNVSEYAAALQKEYPALSNMKLGGIDKIYAFDPAKVIQTLDEDVVRYWLTHPDSLEFTLVEMAAIASEWYGQIVSADRLKRRWRDAGRTKHLQNLTYELGNSTDITKCRCLPTIQKRLAIAARRTADRWAFRGEIAFYSNGEVEINRQSGRQDETAAGKARLRGNGSAVSVEALKNVLSAYSGKSADRSDDRTAAILSELD